MYVLAPLAFSNADVPLHIVASDVVAVTTMFEFTVTVTVPVPVHPFVVPVTLYVVVEFGNACGLAIFDWLNPVAGAQEYEPAPETLICIVSPSQIAGALGLKVKTGFEFTVIVMVSVSLQFKVLPVTVYVVVVAGLAVGPPEVGLFNPVVGAQE